VLDDGRILNIAGDYIAHGVRHPASELITDTWVTRARSSSRPNCKTRSRPSATWLVRENRNLMVGRVKHLERYGLATQLEPGRWIVSDRAEAALQELGERNEVIKTVHRALTSNGLAEERGVGQYALHGEGSGEKIVGQLLALTTPRRPRSTASVSLKRVRDNQRLLLWTQCGH
jgi:type IV secretory pathway VirD2 relaxase